MTASTPKPIVVVTGDRIRDHNLHRQTNAGSSRSLDRRGTTLDTLRAGGAWYIDRLLRDACPSDALDVRGPGVPVTGALINEPGVGDSYSIWGAVPETDRERKKRVWRIQDFLGCRPADAVGTSSIANRDIASPHLLVIDDLDLRFRGATDSWPAALGPDGDPKRIVLKTVAPLADGLIWKTLSDRGWLARTTVVLSVTALRADRAAIAAGLSWDRAIEQTCREFDEGASSRDLAHCRRVVVLFGLDGAASYTRGRLPNGPGAENLADRVRLERFVYDPIRTEGGWVTERPGKSSGARSIVAAAVARHEASPDDFPLFLALGRGLAAARANHTLGAGPAMGTFNCDAAWVRIRGVLRNDARDRKPGDEPASEFRSALPRSASGKACGPSDILADVLGPNPEYVYAKAVDVVVRGVAKALDGAPRAKFGAYVTVDREEIERIHVVRNLIQAYRANAADRRPLSIAVFGPPGSGKSFAIKQLSAELFGGDKKPLEFNLSQVATLGELHGAFQRVRDASIRGTVPLVFWDEFDTAIEGEPLAWLRHFLAPMQDAEFNEGGVSHPFGKAIFVFAGGTAWTFRDFDRSRVGDDEEQGFRAVKGPDFVSRLRGYVDIKGPNPVLKPGSVTLPPDAPWEDVIKCDPAALIRRAAIFRSALERHTGWVIDEHTKFARVSPGVVRAFLTTPRFLHGARSIEAVVTMSTLTNSGRFRAADLPTADQLGLHVSADFLDLATTSTTGAQVVEPLAMACHEAWSEERRRDGWTYAPARNDERKEHDQLLPYADLREEWKEANRLSARVVEAKLRDANYDIVARAASDAEATQIDDAARTELLRIEHDVWMRSRLIQGHEYAPSTEPALRRHRDICSFEEVPVEDQALDGAIVDSIVPTLWEAGFKVVRR